MCDIVRTAKEDENRKVVPLQITLPFPPPFDRLWRKTNWQVTRTDEYRLFSEAVADARKQVERRWSGTGSYRVAIEFHAPEILENVDERVLTVFSELAHNGFWREDWQALTVKAIKGDSDKDNPRVVVTITPVSI